jgi:photosystem II stability/assembly factor-like uncharacterized protein
MRRRFWLLGFVFLALGAPSDPAWRIIGPGGGGAMFYPTISPHDPRTVLVGCDMTGAYLTRDGGQTWRIIDLGQPPQFFVFDPIDPKVIYAKADGLFRTADGGVTWARFLPTAAAIRRITMGDDDAEAYIQHTAQPGGQVTALAIDPAASQSLLLATWERNQAALHQSLDGGTTWRRIADLAGRVSQIWIDPRSMRDDRTLYLAGPNAIFIRRAGRWRSGQSPGTFTAVSAAFPAADKPTVYATAAAKIFVSTDGGATWYESPLPGFQGEARTVAAAPSNPEIAYASYSHLRSPLTQAFGVARTSDAGRHWELVWQHGHDPAANVHDAWISQRFGSGWGGNPRGLAVAPGDANVVYGTDDGRTTRTLDGGKTWAGVYSNRTPDGNWTTNGLDVTTCYGVHFDPFDPAHMFIDYTDIGLWASDNSGASWYSATLNGVPHDWVNTTYWLEFDPRVRGRIWAAMSATHDLPRPKMWRNRNPDTYDGGVVRSDDGGRTWRVQNNGLPATAATHILRTPEGTLYVAGFGRGVFRSADGGEHWVLMNQGLEGAQPFAWRLARAGNGDLYVVIARRSDDGSYNKAGDGAVYRWSGDRWNRLRLPDGVNGPNGLAIDPRDPNRLYLAAWGRSTPDGALDGGIWLSTDAGAGWRRVLGDDQHIYDVTIDAADSRVLYAAGFEQSAWRSTDRGLSWKRLAGFDFKWAHRVVVHPRDRARLYITTFGGSVWTTRLTAAAR